MVLLTDMGMMMVFASRHGALGSAMSGFFGQKTFDFAGGSSRISLVDLTQPQGSPSGRTQKTHSLGKSVLPSGFIQRGVDGGSAAINRTP